MQAACYVLALMLLPGLQIGQAAPGSARLATLVPETPALATGGIVPAAPGPVREALKQGGFPWYDSGTDRVRPIWAPRSSWMKSLGEAIDRFFRRMPRLPRIGIRGDWLGMILLATVLTAFFAFLIALWLRREPFVAASGAARTRPGSALLLAQLPGDLFPGLDDPWAEAQKRRLAGDLSGAVVYLFAHQLLSLNRAGLIRLAPGWTGRHYVRWLRDPVLVQSLAATLCLFEEYYYGHRPPSPVEFEDAWSRALESEDRRRALERSP